MLLGNVNWPRHSHCYEAISHYKGDDWKAPVAMQLQAFPNRKKKAATNKSLLLLLAMEQEEY